MVSCQLDYARRINPSLIHAGCDYVIRAITIPAGAHAEVSIPGFSDVWGHDGNPPTKYKVSPPLNWGALAQLSEPRNAQLEVKINGSLAHRLDIVLLPLFTWDMRLDVSRATAAFVFETSKIVLDLVQTIGCTPPIPDLDSYVPDTQERMTRLYEGIQQAFRTSYWYDRGGFTMFEQIVRFPAQMLHDGGGTCCDFTFFSAAACIAAGLRPVICILGQEYGDRHAILGVWNEEAINETEPLCGTMNREILVDKRVLNAAIKKGQLLVVETTWLAKPDSPYGKARQMAERMVEQLGTLVGVNVQAARNHELSISPLPGVVRIGYGVMRIGYMEESVVTDLPTKPADELTTLRAEQAAQTLHQYALEVISSIRDEDKGKKLPLQGSRVRIGRRRTNTIVLDDRELSRDHAAITVFESEVYLQDLDSMNGTFLEGVCLRPLFPEPLRIGDTFWLGPSKNICFRLVHV